jgi:ABC-2 type transport system permease protein
MKQLITLVRREFWEHRGLWITPLVIAAVLCFVPLLVGHSDLNLDVRNDHHHAADGHGLAGHDPGSAADGRAADPGDGADADDKAGADVPALDSQQFTFAIISMGVPFYIAAGILLVIYLLDCLYSERRDRSVLFWKSMPVSDTKTVLSKYLVAMVLVPVGTYLIAMLTGLVLSLGIALSHHTTGGYLSLWDTAGWLRAQGFMLYGLVVVVLWYAPYAAYLMLASAWARRAVYAWAIVPPILIAMLERMLFGTSYFGAIVSRRFGDLVGLAFGANREISINITDASSWFRAGHGMRPVTQGLDGRMLFENPQLWFGLAVAALFLWAAIVVRRNRDEA